MDLTHKQNTIEFSMQWGGGGWSKPILVALGVDTILTKSSYMQLILFMMNSEGPGTIIEMKHAAAAAVCYRACADNSGKINYQKQCIYKNISS